MKCAVVGCPDAGKWIYDNASWCDHHSRDVLMSEDREDFADDYARDADREYGEVR